MSTPEILEGMLSIFDSLTPFSIIDSLEIVIKQ